MTTSKSGNGSEIDSDALRAVTQALRHIASDGERVTLAQISREAGLEPAATERAMCNIEHVAPVSARRVVERGPVAWKVSL